MYKYSLLWTLLSPLLWASPMENSLVKPEEHFPLALHGATSQRGLVGDLAFGTVSGWYPNASIYQLRVGGGFAYIPTWFFGGGIEALGSTLSDSSRFSSARFYAFGRKTWTRSQRAFFVGATLRIENNRLEYITSTDNPIFDPNNPLDRELRDKLTTSIAELDLGHTWQITPTLYLPMSYGLGISKHSQFRSELCQGLSLDMKKIWSIFFAPASLAYFALDLVVPLPGIQKGPQYLGSLTLGF